MLVRHETREPDAIQRPSALRLGTHHLPGKGGRHEEIGERKVAAPRPLKASYLPVVVNVRRGGREHHHTEFRGAAVITDDACASDGPLGVSDTTGKSPPTTHAVPPVHRHSRAGWPHSTCGGWEVGIGKDVPNGLVCEKGCGPPNAGRPDHRAPASGGIDACHRLEDLDLGHWIGFRPAEYSGELQRQEA